MQNLSDILPLLCTPAWPSRHVSENQEYEGLVLLGPSVVLGLSSRSNLVQWTEVSFHLSRTVLSFISRAGKSSSGVTSSNSYIIVPFTTFCH